MDRELGEFVVHQTLPDIVWRITKFIGGDQKFWPMLLVEIEHAHGPLPTNEDCRAIFIGDSEGVLIGRLEDPNAMLLLALESQ